MIALVSLASAAFSACDLAVTSLKTVDSNANPHTPKLGETYFMRVDWTVSGTTVGAYDIKFEMANISYTWHLTTPNPGSYYGYFGWNLPLDGKFPMKVTLDVGNVQPDTNRANNVASGQIRPILPAAALSWIEPKVLYSKHTASVKMGPTSQWSRLVITTGVPTTQTFQTVTKHQILSGTQFLSLPTNYPGLKVDVANPLPNSINMTQQKMTLKVKNCKINVGKITDTWADFASLPSDIQYWTQPETMVQSTDPAIAAFVTRVLPKNFKNKLTPIQAARSLFLGVVKEISYVTPAPFDAKTVLTNKTGDCGGYAALYAACLRNIGIPARARSGYRLGTNAWHVWPEIYMPSVGWFDQDPTDSDGIDPGGTYAYQFAYVNDLNRRASIGIGYAFTEPVSGLTNYLFQTMGWWGWWTNRGSEVATVEAILSESPIP